VGVVHVAPASDTSRPGVTVRAFAAPMGNPEDPVTGSLNGSLAQWLIAEGLAPQRTRWPRANAWAAPGACTSARTSKAVWVGARGDLHPGHGPALRTCSRSDVFPPIATGASMRQRPFQQVDVFTATPTWATSWR
jgi:predicted PhzF superfamily epimerase YddE/YHI9